MTSRVAKPDTNSDFQLRECLSSDSLTSFVMVAGAGSGKTTSLVKALAYLAKERGKALRSSDKKIACITYTEVAVREIRRDIGNDNLFHVSTIHSFLWEVIRPFQIDIKAWVNQRIEGKIADLEDKLAKPKIREQTRIKAEADIVRYRLILTECLNVDRYRYGTGSDYSNGILGHDDVLKMVPELIQKHSLLQSVIAQRYPYVFVDESQDTVPDVVAAFKCIDQRMGPKFCLGFFGDPMQKIYATGIGPVSPGEGWVTITKPENFRCPTKVLTVINHVRAPADGLTQTGGRMELNGGNAISVDGSAHMFVYPNDGHRAERIEAVRRWMAEQNDDPLWLSGRAEADLRVLVIVHRMAAKRLGFAELYAAFNDDAPSTLKDGFLDGTVWALRPFLSFILPLVIAQKTDSNFDVMNLLRANCPRLEADRLKDVEVAELLGVLRRDVDELSRLMTVGSGASVRDVLEFVRDGELMRLDDRILAYLGVGLADEQQEVEADEAPENDANAEMQSVRSFFACPADQLWGYLSYIEDESPFATQQGIKGAEFERVVVIIDEEEGSHTHFSYDKYFGLTELSDTDKKNIAENKDSVLDRTRRLFYVCCSRAVKDLAVVMFTPAVDLAARKIKEKGIFPAECIHT